MVRNSKAIAYLRVSTGKQQASGLGLEAQKAAIDKHLALAGLRLVSEFTETESGRNNKRPELERALAACHRHKAILVIAKLDRLSRNVHFLSGLMEAKVEFVACDMPSANKLTLHVLAAVAENEAEMISARTKAALEAARARGTRLGGLRVNSASIGASGAKASAAVRQQSACDDARYLFPAIQEMEGGLSLRDIARRLNDGGFTTPRGSQWTSTQVQRLFSHLDDLPGYERWAAHRMQQTAS